MPRLACLTGALVFFALAAPGSAAAQINWQGLPYFVFEGPALVLATDGSWSGAKSVNVGRFTPSNGTYGLTRSYKRRYIWGRTCGRSKERRTFRKQIYVPGQAYKGTFSLGYGPARSQPFDGAVMEVNGEKIVRLPKAGRRFRGYRAGAVPLAALRAFRYGTNTIEIRATKRKLRKGQKCNNRKVPRFVGVLGDLTLDFAGDIRVTPPVLSKEIVRNVVNGQVVGIEGTARFTNAGPSAALGGDMQLSATGPGTSAVAPLGSYPGPPFHTCGVVEFAPSTFKCRFGEFRAGTSSSFRFTAANRVNTAYFKNGAERFNVYLQANDRTLDDPNPRDNSQIKTVVLCMAGATDPDCL